MWLYIIWYFPKTVLFCFISFSISFHFLLVFFYKLISYKVIQYAYLLKKDKPTLPDDERSIPRNVTNVNIRVSGHDKDLSIVHISICLGRSSIQLTIWRSWHSSHSREIHGNSEFNRCWHYDATWWCSWCQGDRTTCRRSHASFYKVAWSMYWRSSTERTSKSVSHHSRWIESGVENEVYRG